MPSEPVESAPLIGEPPILPEPPPPNQLEWRERFHGLDILRTWAMLLGIYLHGVFSFIPGNGDWLVHDNQAHDGFRDSLLLIHGFRMQLFFVLAGFFARLVRLRIGAWRYLGRRMVRIGVPFLLGMIVLGPMVYFIWQWGVDVHGTVEDSELGRIPKTLAKCPTAHLWFLQYLLCLYVVAFLLDPFMWLFTRGWLGRFFDFLASTFMRIPLKTLILPFVVIWFLLPKSSGEHSDVMMSGRAFVPLVGGLGYYAIFFFFGWALHRGVGRLPALGRVSQLILHGLSIPLVVWAFHHFRENAWDYIDPRAGNPQARAMFVYYYLYSVYTWSMIFFTIGLTMRLFKRRRAKVEYMADASYFFYWLHFPVVLPLQVIVARWDTNGILKVVWIVGIACLMMWPIYHFGVRYTWVGRIFNGRRERAVT
ncbi:MAG: acyltransferase family protein [Limisphaerales bacterium]